MHCCHNWLGHGRGQRHRCGDWILSDNYRELQWSRRHRDSQRAHGPHHHSLPNPNCWKFSRRCLPRRLEPNVYSEWRKRYGHVDIEQFWGREHYCLQRRCNFPRGRPSYDHGKRRHQSRHPAYYSAVAALRYITELTSAGVPIANPFLREGNRTSGFGPARHKKARVYSEESRLNLPAFPRISEEWITAAGAPRR